MERAAEEEGAGKLKVSDVMTREVIAVRADTGIQEIARLLKENRIGGVPVIDDDGNVVGMVNKGNLFLKRKRAPYGIAMDAPMLFGQFIEPENLAEIYQEARYLTAADVMSEATMTVDPQDQVGHVAETMMWSGLRRVPVAHYGKLVGIISRSDIIDLLAQGNE